MSKTKPDKLLVLFEDLAEKMNINIVQGKGDFQGGMCSVNDEAYIVLNKLKPVDQRLAVLVREFSRLVFDGILGSLRGPGREDGSPTFLAQCLS